MKPRIITPATVALALAAALAGCSSKPKLVAPDCEGKTGAANTGGLAPVVWDDDKDTWLRFPNRQRIPAITTLREDGREAAVNTSGDPDGGLLRVHGIHTAIVLRDGARVACLRNMAFDRAGGAPQQRADAAVQPPIPGTPGS